MGRSALRKMDMDAATQELLRAALLGALEDFGRRLGVRWLAIVNLHGGRGALPAGWRQRERAVTRLLALSTRAQVPLLMGDDLLLPLNQPATARHLYWRRL